VNLGKDLARGFVDDILAFVLPQDLKPVCILSGLSSKRNSLSYLLLCFRFCTAFTLLKGKAVCFFWGALNAASLE
jgi:hypothetical protein